MRYCRKKKSTCCLVKIFPSAPTSLKMRRKSLVGRRNFWLDIGTFQQSAEHHVINMVTRAVLC